MFQTNSYYNVLLHVIRNIALFKSTERKKMPKPNDKVDESPSQLLRNNFLLRIKEVCKVLGISRSQLQMLRKEQNDFPKAITITGNICFKSEDIINWINNNN